MPKLVSDDFLARASRVIRWFESSQSVAGGGPNRASTTPDVFCRITLEIVDANSNGIYEAEEVRWEDDGLGTPTSKSWVTVTNGRTFDADNPLQEVAETNGMEIGMIVLAKQRATHWPNEVSVFKRPTLWVFDRADTYGVDGRGAWAQITGKSSGNYSWKQKERDGITDASPAITGNVNAREVNGDTQVPVGAIVWLRNGGDFYKFDNSGLAGRSGFPARLTAETPSGEYSWSETEADGSTLTGNTGTGAVELSGRTGIPIPSYVMMFGDASGSGACCFEYHGAPSGSEHTVTQSEGWDRASQGTDRGVDVDLMSRLAVDQSTGEMTVADVDHTADANGHEETWNIGPDRTIGVGTPTTETYEYVDCETELTTIFRVSAADYIADGLHDYLWAMNGSNLYIRCKNAGLSAGAATSPLPCIKMMASAPASCADLDLSPFSDNFNDNDIDTCLWYNYGGTAATESGGKLVFSSSDTNHGHYIKNVDWPSDEPWHFAIRATTDGLSGYSSPDSWEVVPLTIATDAGEMALSFAFGPSGIYSRGIFSRDGAGHVLEQTISSGGISNALFEILYDGTDTITFKYNGSTVHTFTHTGEITITGYFLATCRSSLGDTIDATFDNFEAE